MKSINTYFDLKNKNNYFNLFLAFSIIMVLLGVATNIYALWGIPFLLIGLFFTIIDYKLLYFFFIASIPLTTDLDFANGFSIDAPAEPLMLVLLGISVLLLIQNHQKISIKYLYHPISVLLILQIFWIFISAFYATNTLFSFKFLISKFWYIIPTYCLGIYYISKPKGFDKFSQYSFYSLLFVISIVLARHIQKGLSFDSVNHILGPFFSNHVEYACITVVLLPFLYFGYLNSKNNTFRFVFKFGVFILLIAVQFAYTRAAYVALLGAIGYYFIVKMKLTKICIVIALLVTIVGVNYYVQNDNFLNHAPNFNKTISHTDFNNLIEATAKGEDISTMERVYRWVAGKYMVEANWLTGVGPNNFYTTYKEYTVLNFKTYVSDNVEKSGIHCYYLMVLVEQGVVGFIIWMVMVIYSLIMGENLYHRLENKQLKRMVMAALLSLIIIYLTLIINDLIENIKIGPYLFFSFSILVGIDIRSKLNSNKTS